MEQSHRPGKGWLNISASGLEGHKAWRIGQRLHLGVVTHWGIHPKLEGNQAPRHLPTAKGRQGPGQTHRTQGRSGSMSWKALSLAGCWKAAVRLRRAHPPGLPVVVLIAGEGTVPRNLSISDQRCRKGRQVLGGQRA